MCGRAVNREGEGKNGTREKRFGEVHLFSSFLLLGPENCRLLPPMGGPSEEGVCNRSCAIGTQHSFFNAFTITEIMSC